MTARSDQVRGYLMIGGTALMFGSAGVFVRMTDMPAAMLLVLRMSLAGVLLAVVLARFRWWREMRRPGVAPKLILLGIIDAAQLFTFFIAVRYMDVALAVFLSYMSPIYIALLAPRVLKQRTEPVVVVALVLSLAGIVTMLAPGWLDPDLKLSTLGVICGVAAGLLLAVFFLIAKSARNDVEGGTMLISNCAVSTLVLLPLALVQFFSSGYQTQGRDLLAAVGLAVICTAVAGTIFLQGMRYIRVQHTAIVGLLEPAAAPAYALVFLGEQPALWTLVGGALILAAAVLVVLFGEGEDGLAGSPEEALAEAEALP
jgi:drug/metabolite transporter (DMT)-like permease